jgi:hypothetical protein
MKKLNPIEYLTGFLMGTFFGVFIENILLAIGGLFLPLFGWKRPAFDWWMLIPLITIPLLFGIWMGKNIASLHLEDY